MKGFKNVAESFAEVNRKYAKPEIETTLFVKICLLTLRIYLLLMVGLMVYALVKQAMAENTEAQPPAATQPTTAPEPPPAKPAQTP